MVPGPDPSPVPAPGPLRLLQSFASTLAAEPGVDPLRTRDDAAAWLRAAALLPAAAGLSNSEHAALLRLRASIRDVLAAHAAGREDAAAAAAAARLTRALADGRLVLTAGPASTVQLASAARASYPNLVATVAIAIAGSAAAGTWTRLKSCPVPHCGEIFYGDSATRCPAHAAGP